MRLGKSRVYCDISLRRGGVATFLWPEIINNWTALSFDNCGVAFNFKISNLPAEFVKQFRQVATPSNPF